MLSLRSSLCDTMSIFTVGTGIRCSLRFAQLSQVEEMSGGYCQHLDSARYLAFWYSLLPAPPSEFTLFHDQTVCHRCALPTPFSTPHHRFPAMVFLLDLPRRAVLAIFLGPPLPFIPLALNPLTSPELRASPDLECRFLPPNPNLASFLARLWFGVLLPWSGRPRLPGLLSSLSTPTSKRSASLVSRSPPFSARSVWYGQPC